MKSLLGLALSFIALSAQAVPYKVVLDADPELIQDRSGTVLLGIKYADGTLNAGEIFNLKELKTGVTEKTFEVNEAGEITVCEFQWAIMSSPPAVPGLPSKKLPELLMPEKFSSVALKSECAPDAKKKEIVLSPAPYLYKKVTLKVTKETLEKRDALLLLVSFLPVSKDDNYKSKTWTTNKEGGFPVSVLIPKSGFFKVTAHWILKNGGKKEDTFETSETEIEIR